MIYFIQAEGVGHIKIGFTDGIGAEGRLAELQVGSPVRLNLLGTLPGDKSTEMDLHRRFSFAHLHGEWFKSCPELLDFLGPRVEDSRQGPAEVSSRFIQIKILTVNRKQLTKTLLDQIPYESIIDWEAVAVASLNTDVSDIFVNEFERGEPWGWIFGKRYRRPAKILIWQLKNELRRWAVELLSFPWRVSDWHTNGTVIVEDGTVLVEGGQYAWKKNDMERFETMAISRYEDLDQLFIGV